LLWHGVLRRVVQTLGNDIPVLVVLAGHGPAAPITAIAAVGWAIALIVGLIPLLVGLLIALLVLLVVGLLVTTRLLFSTGSDPCGIGSSTSAFAGALVGLVTTTLAP